MIEILSDKYLDDCKRILKENNFELASENIFIKRYCYVENEKALGYIQYSIYYDRAELDYIVVDKDYRNKKVASKLIEYMIDDCKKNDCKNITLEVRYTNNCAIKLYEKFNFKKVAVRKNYYENEDAYLYELKLEGE